MPTHVDRYVISTCTAGGNGTQEIESGANRAYATLQEWNAGEAADIRAVGTDETHTVHCSRGTNASVGSDTTAVALNGWNTDSTHFITIQGSRTDPEDTGFNNTGIFDASGYYTRDCAAGYGLNMQEDYTICDGIQFEQSSSGTFDTELGCQGGAIDGLIYRNNWLKKTGTGENCRGIQHGGTGDPYGYFYNNVIVGFKATFNSCSGILLNAEGRIYNNTFYDCDAAIRLSANVDNAEPVDIKNNAVIGNWDDYLNSGSSSAITIDYNAADDTDLHVGTYVDMNDNASSEWTNAFTSHTGDDFTVKNTSAAIYNVGITNGDDSDVPTTDYLGNARDTGAGGNCDIGAFELVVSGAHPVNPMGHPLRGALGGPIG